MDEERPMTSAEMIRQAKQDLQQEPIEAISYEMSRPEVEVEVTIEEVADELATQLQAPTATRARPQPHQRGSGRRVARRREQIPQSPFEQRAPGAGRAVAGAIPLALFVLGIAVFLAAVSVTP
jgi:hypothetical protein